MIVFDTETSGLVHSNELPLDQQPEIIELAAVRLRDEDLTEVGSLEFLLRPRNPISDEITTITGITNEMLTGERSFAARLPELWQFFLGEATLVAHNIAFDIAMLTFELRRIDYLTRFPWPPRQLDTVELTRDVAAKRSQEALVERVKGHKAAVAHRAMADVRELCDIVRWLRGLDGRI